MGSLNDLKIRRVKPRNLWMCFVLCSTTGVLWAGATNASNSEVVLGSPNTIQYVSGPLRHSEVVFMYAASDEAYRAYDATFVGWGGADTAEKVKRHHDLGVRCTGSMWCLTAGAENIQKAPKLRAAWAVAESASERLMLTMLVAPSSIKDWNACAKAPGDGAAVSGSSSRAAISS